MNIATLFLQYPACSTCQKAKKWLTENNIEFTNRLIVEENPTVEELKAWIPRSGLPVKKFFNTSGLGLSLKPWGIALKFLFLHHENILFPND